MESKLQELTSKIYNEGIEKARTEAKAILHNAHLEADQLVTNARAEAAKILDSANRESEELKRNVHNELQLSTRQALSAIKQQIIHLIGARMLSEPVKESVNDKEFIKNIIETLINNWSQKAGHTDLALVLPQSDEQKLGKYFTEKAHLMLKDGLTVKFDDRMTTGFRIGPKDNSYVLSFTDDDFEQFFRHYLKPRTIKLLFGGE